MQGSGVENAEELFYLVHMISSQDQLLVGIVVSIVLILLIATIIASWLYRAMRKQFRTKFHMFSSRLEAASNQQEIDKAVNKERDRISKVIHDEVGNKLIALLFELDRNFKQESFGIAGTQLLWQLSKELKVSIEDTRTLVRELSSFELDSNGVAGELQKFCQSKEGFYGVTVGFAGLSGARRFEFEREKEVVAMVKELVYNSFKFSGCWHIDVVLTWDWDNKKLIVEVSDDGYGMRMEDMKQPKDSGLAGMRTRCDMMGAELQLVKTKRGACIQIVVPL
jgi:signal transduction histidine kinase